MVDEIFKGLLEVIAAGGLLGCLVYYGMTWLSDYREEKRKEQADEQHK